ncbi:hypothetical protein V5O48_003517 [Marasmius crinis-equi]|uniref:Uncharacterized protein n=1 Tax=Marasmius crinis-equi TaxID=585013 RepID=A0ABR3FSL9_9AGAR
MSSYAQFPQKRSRRHTESATAFRNPYSDAFSSEYSSSGRIPGLRGDRSYEITQKGVAEDELQRALRAQERARARKAAHNSSPRRIAVPAPVPPVPHHPALYPIPGHRNDLHFPSRDVAPPQVHMSPSRSERVRSSSQRFAGIRDSLTLPYLESRSRTKSKPRPPMLDLPPGINQPDRKIEVEQVFPTYAAVRHPSTPPRKAVPVPLPVHRESLKQLAPLPPFNPYSRPRADSLTAMVEDRRLCYSPPPKKNYESYSTFSVPSKKLRRMNTVNDLFSRIHSRADALGLKTTL